MQTSTRQVRFRPEAISVTRMALAVAGFALASAAAAQPAQSAADVQSKRRYQVRVMEGALVGAVSHGAGQVSRQLQPVSQSLVFLSGAARARGFALDGYGLFFDVEIPAMRESAINIMRTLEPDYMAMRRTFDQLRTVAQQVADTQQKSTLDQALRRLEALMPQGGRQVRASDERSVTAADLPETARAGLAATVPVAPDPAPLGDPSALYTETVKNALIEAMLEYGGPMGLQPDEWLTVAARDAEGPLSPAENYDPATIILRVRGSDLAAFRAERITREEARKRVEVREF